MFDTSLFRKISPVLWEISRGYRPGMRVPARVYASEAMLEENRPLARTAYEHRDASGDEMGAVPDIHEGYGFPIRRCRV